MLFNALLYIFRERFSDFSSESVHIAMPSFLADIPHLRRARKAKEIEHNEEALCARGLYNLIDDKFSRKSFLLYFLSCDSWSSTNLVLFSRKKAIALLPM